MPDDPPEPPSDLATLVAAAQGGEPGAMDALLRRIQGPVKDVARLLLGDRLRSWIDSDDVLQEALTAVFRALPTYRWMDEASLFHWAATICANRIRSLAEHHLAQKRGAGRIGDERALGDAFEPASGVAPPAVAARSERGTAVRECLGALSDEHRDVLVLVEYLAAGWSTVADRLGRSEAACRMLHARAVAALGRELRRRGFADR